MKRIDVRAEGGGYPIIIEDGLLARSGTVVRERLGRAATAAVVTNPTVAAHHAGPLLESLRGAGFSVHLVEILDGERYKTLETVRRLWTMLLEAGLNRTGLVVSLGGGVTGDLAGFAAATFMRGVPVVHVPTTLLAMVDASIGGKTGVDLPQGKNLVGVFKQPEAVIVDPGTLETLPAAQIASGMAEVLKHGLIADPALFEELEAGKPADLGALVHRAVLVKVAIVEEDPGEAGRRTLLNLGHTFGHGFEAASGYDLGHGPAVAAGLIAAARLAHGLGRCEASLVERIEGAVRVQGLPAMLGGLSADEVIDHMKHDKKRRDAALRFVIPEEPGHVAIVDDPPERLVADAVARVLES
ncbi:MAG: 3-dehydroquinate synthase [Deltaproteobacteria bacterium]|nr:3-dehydroquinate synthase [Deltaproteobacteria bacterium]